MKGEMGLEGSNKILRHGWKASLDQIRDIMSQIDLQQLNGDQIDTLYQESSHLVLELPAYSEVSLHCLFPPKSVRSSRDPLVRHRRQAVDSAGPFRRQVSSSWSPSLCDRQPCLFSYAVTCCLESTWSVSLCSAQDLPPSRVGRKSREAVAFLRDEQLQDSNQQFRRCCVSRTSQIS